MDAGQVQLPYAGDRTAVVIGASLAGLTAARVLADYFDRVVVLDRDRLPSGPEHRAGVPQSRHLHALMRLGLVRLAELFPGFQAEMQAEGAVAIEWPADVLWLSPAGWSGRFRPGMQVLGGTRPLLEWVVRRRVAAFKGVEIREHVEVTGLVGSPEGERVVGVELRPRGAEAAAAPEILPAALVVDASGRNSRATEWLAALGYPAPAETAINAGLRYASRLYTIPPDFSGDWASVLLQSKAPGNSRLGVLGPVEGHRWMVTLSGGPGQHPPTDDVGFLAFARGLRSPLIHDAIAGAEPVSTIHGYARMENRRRHFEAMARWPEGLLVVGDAACSFNPVYGQGISVAADQAVALGACLEEQRRQHPDGDLRGLARRAQREMARRSAGAWMMATGEDLRFPATEGGHAGRVAAVTNRYVDRVIRVAMAEPRVNRAFSDVMHLMAPPAALFRPPVVRRVLLARRAG